MNRQSNHSTVENAIEATPLFRDMGVDDHPFLKGLNARHLQLLAQCAMQTSFGEDRSIFREGDAADHFYLIQEGTVRLEAITEKDQVIPIQIIGPGQVLGWSWLFPPYLWRFDARAMEPVNAIAFYAPKLRDQCEQDHDLGYELMKRTAEVMLERLQATRRHLSVLSEAFKRVERTCAPSRMQQWAKDLARAKHESE